jgi:hypothetical protein
VTHFTWTGTKNATLIVQTKSNISKTIPNIVLQLQLQLIDEAHMHKGIDVCWKTTMAKLGL